MGAWPALAHFKLAFLTREIWNPVTDQFGALAPIYGTLVTSFLALLLAIPVSFGIAIFLTELAPVWLKRPVGVAIELLAAVPSIIFGIWGLFVLAPILQAHVQPWLIELGRSAAADRQAVPGTALRHRHADRGLRARDHGAAVHLRGDARRVRDGAGCAQGVRLRPGGHDLGSDLAGGRARTRAPA